MVEAENRSLQVFLWIPDRNGDVCAHTHTCSKDMIWGLESGAIVESAHCSSRGPTPTSEALQFPVTTALGDLVPPASGRLHSCAHKHMDPNTNYFLKSLP